MPSPAQGSALPWWDNLDVLKDFVAEHGRLPRQRETHPHNGVDVPVGRWLMHQRQRGARDAEQEQALREVLAGYPASREDAWEHHRRLLVEYAAAHAELPTQRTWWRDAPLGQWVADQRRAHRLGRLSAARRMALERTPGWTWSVTETHFENGLAHFIDYRAEHQSGWVPEDYTCTDGFALGTWAKERRRAAASEPPLRARRLAAAGFSYHAPRPRRTGRSPRAFAGSIGARRTPHLSVDEVLELRAVSALARAHLRTTEPYTGITRTDLLPHEVEILTDAGWPPKPPTFITQWDTVRIDWAALEEPVTRAVRNAAYVLFVNGWPTLAYAPPQTHIPDAPVGGLQGLAELWDMVDAVHPFTPRELAWLTGEAGTYTEWDPNNLPDRADRREVIARHRETWLRAYRTLEPFHPGTPLEVWATAGAGSE